MDTWYPTQPLTHAQTASRTTSCGNDRRRSVGRRPRSSMRVSQIQQAAHGIFFVAVADLELLHRMLLNLVLNALRETPTDGTVSLKGQVAGCDVSIVVEDTGPGIQEEQLARIFDPMFSTSREGCGLGLPIVKRIVESHNGTVSVGSSRNGTRFLITIPHNMEVVRESLTYSR